MPPPKFDHLVVLMMENRSFDHMLGLLYTKDDPPPNGQTFDGVADVDGKPRTNPAPGDPVAVAPATTFYGVTQDPHHDFMNVQWQLFSKDEKFPNEVPVIPCPPVGSMQGFAWNYADANGDPVEIMSVFPTYDGANQPSLRVLPALAREFAVCDNWFASVPTQTLPNRSFCNAGTSNGFVENTDDWANLNTNQTIFTALGSAGTGDIPPWRIYHDHADQEPGFALTIYIHWPELCSYDKNPDYRRSVDQFEVDAAAGDLPAYSFIEPRITAYFADPGSSRSPNDQHPKQDICHGENLINRIYSALFGVKSPLRNRTLLVITYDEHGGIYDHVSPPFNVPAPPPPQPLPPPSQLLTIVPPDPPPFDFTRLGVRVPAVIVSPYIPAGTVYHPSLWCDHTAIIKTLTTRWNLKSLGHRDAAAPDLSELLTLEEPRTDLPLPQSWPNPLLDERPAERIPANDLQRDFVQLVARAHGLPLLGPVRTVADVINFFHFVQKHKSGSQVDPNCPSAPATPEGTAISPAPTEPTN